MKELYNVDMEINQYNKRIDDIPNPDIVIFMGCNVDCPILVSKCNENWCLEDPTGKSDEEFKLIIHEIEYKILELKTKVSNL